MAASNLTEGEVAAIKNAAASLDAFAPNITPVGKQLVLAMGWVSKFGNIGGFAPDGHASWNWGAIPPLPGETYIEQEVRLSDGTTATYRYASFTSQYAGLQALFERWIPASVFKLVQKGDVHGLVMSLHAEKFFPKTTPALIESHTVQLEHNAQVIADALGQKNLVVESEKPKSFPIVPVVILGTVFGLFFATLHAKRG